MINKLYKLLMISCLFVAGSCTKNFEEINTNNNALEVMDAGPLINGGVKNILDFFGGRMNREIFTNYVGQIHAGGGTFQRFGYVQSQNGTNFSTFYIQCLQPLNTVVDNFENESYQANNLAVAKILRAYIYSQGVAIWGAIPMNEALKGTMTVKYNTEEEIYTQLMEDLESAVNSIDSNLAPVSASGDAIFGGDLDKWKKFGNSLRLRIVLRLSECAEGELLQKLQATAVELMNDDEACINSNDDNAMARYDAISGAWSDLYNRCVYTVATLTDTNKMGIDETLIIHMLPYGDPRLDYYAELPVNSDTHFGKGRTAPAFITVNENPHTGKTIKDYSTIGSEFIRADGEYRFINYAEVCFNKAELALLGWGGKDDAYAQKWYEQGIVASMGQANVDGTEYMIQPGIQWGVPTVILEDMSAYTDWLGISSSIVKGDSDFDVKRNQIVMQHWLALFPYALDIWTLHRRTQILELLPQTNPVTNAIQTNAKWAPIPLRILYPSTESETNGEALAEAQTWLNGEDCLATPLCFTKEVKVDYTGYPDGLPTEL